MLAIDHCNIFSSVYFLAAMSIDRYLVVLATARSRRMPGAPSWARSPACASGWASQSQCCPSSPAAACTTMSCRSRAVG